MVTKTSLLSTVSSQRSWYDTQRLSQYHTDFSHVYRSVSILQLKISNPPFFSLHESSTSLPAYQLIRSPYLSNTPPFFFPHTIRHIPYTTDLISSVVVATRNETKQSTGERVALAILRSEQQEQGRMGFACYVYVHVHINADHEFKMGKFSMGVGCCCSIGAVY